jgi:hypothetical protein
VVPDICTVIDAPPIQTSIFNCRYLRCYCRYHTNSMRVILQTWCQMQGTASSFRYVNSGPHIYKLFTAPHICASVFDGTYQRCYGGNIDNSMCVILQTWYQIQRTSCRLHYVNCGPGHIQCNYSSVYSGFNILVNASALRLEISRQFNERYSVSLVSNGGRFSRLSYVNCGHGHIE